MPLLVSHVLEVYGLEVDTDMHGLLAVVAIQESRKRKLG
jgi:hypothetical protein